ncbi:hypothetical protein BDR07DRAFT_1339852 [Suillus spraguei]|nr:hypothetical protein BDR07DRAFT_1339852 [Suillus spraguei]
MCLVLFCVFLYLVGIIQAAPTTNATNTTTNDSFRSSSFTTRTLWTIVSSSVLTLLACIYSAIHANIPSPMDSPNRILRRRLGIMMMALIAPELIVTWAMRQWISARQVTSQFKKSGYPRISLAQSEEKESESHEQNRSLLAVLAEAVLSTPAFLRHFPETLVRSAERAVKDHFSEQSEDCTWTQTHSFFLLMGGFMLYVDEKPYHTLQPDQLLKLIRARCIDTPILTANQIHDRSKGNAISKGLVILQVAWFVMQLITRAIYHLETTQLEVGTLAFAVLNFLTYAVWWNKPLDVQCSYPVYWKSTESRPEEYIKEPDSDERDEFAPLWILAPVFSSILELMGWFTIPTCRKLRVPTFDGSTKLGYSGRIILSFAALLMATIFGGIHCMAWFFAFPTHLEQVLWRISAVAITCTPWLGVLTSFPIVSNPQYAAGVLLYALYIIFYIVTRAILLILMFTTLHNLPPDAYKAVSWTSLVPHL